ncbi:hypothetical protein ACLX1H_009373 [Fusarium chlamydosporum]
MPTDILVQRNLVDTEGTDFLASGFNTDATEWKVRLDSVPGQDNPVPYTHHNLQDLAESAASCVFCAMIWERLTNDESLTYRSRIAEMKKTDVVGIPVVKPDGTFYAGILSFAILFVFWSGDNWKGDSLYSFHVFKTISKSLVLRFALMLLMTSDVENKDNRAIWKPVFDRQQSLIRIKHWLESSARTSSFGAQLPTRLLYCQPSLDPGFTPTVKLVDTTNLDPSTRYVALTHRWGTVQPLMLLKVLRDSFHESIPFASIPPTFRDAIKLANDIGIEYIWIDSLCIIQDSKDDWQAEAARMASVYSQAYVTIAATAAKDSAAGLKEPTSMLRHPCEITPSWTGFENEIPSGPLRIIIRSAFCDEVLSRPLFRRGWTFQEWILSPKTIHVARDQLWWTSATNMKSQGYAANETCEGFDFDVDRKYVHTMAPGTLYSLASESIESLPRVWHNLLQEYMSRDLTFESDRLIAFAGIATLYQSLAKIPPGSYLAGIWRQVLLQDLLWTVDNGRKVLPPQIYRGPSWSWASVEPAQNWAGRFLIGSKSVNIDLEPDEEPWAATVTVREASVETIESEFGSVCGGHLVFHGPLIKARLCMVMIDLSDRLTAKQAAEFVPGGKLRYVRNHVAIPYRISAAKTFAHTELKITMAQLDAVPMTVQSDEEIDIYLAVIYYHIDLDGAPIAHALALIRGYEKGEYRRIGYVEMSEDVLDSWKESRDFGVFGALTDEDD